MDFILIPSPWPIRIARSNLLSGSFSYYMYHSLPPVESERGEGVGRRTNNSKGRTQRSQRFAQRSSREEGGAALWTLEPSLDPRAKAESFSADSLFQSPKGGSRRRAIAEERADFGG
jgi:hypothetical protein